MSGGREMTLKLFWIQHRLKPSPAPKRAPIEPIIRPSKIKILLTEAEVEPIDFKIPISFLFSKTIITKVLTILKAATATIRLRAKNMAYFSRAIQERSEEHTSELQSR